MPTKSQKSVKKYTVEEVKDTAEEKKEETEKTKEKPDSGLKDKPSSTTETPDSDTPDESQISSFKFADVKSSDSEDKTQQSSVPQETVEKQTPKEDVESTRSNESASSDESWLNEVKADDIEESSKGGKKKIFVFFLVFVLMGALVGGGFYYYKTNIDKSLPVKVDRVGEVVTPTDDEILPVEKPEEEEIDASLYAINILNGSGMPGEAGKVSDLLESLGFEDINTGNADSYDYIETEISLKEDSPEGLYDLVKETLEDSYIVSRSKTDLDEKSTYDVVVIVGSKKAQSSD